MTKPSPGRPTKNIIPPIPADGPKEIAEAIFRSADKKIRPEKKVSGR